VGAAAGGSIATYQSKRSRFYNNICLCSVRENHLKMYELNLYIVEEEEEKKP